MNRARIAGVVAVLLAAALTGCSPTSSTGIPAPEPVVGVTHTQDSADDYPAGQVIAATTTLARHPMLQNQYLMGWGADNPEPSPGVFDWTSLDQRMNLIKQTRGVPVLTLAGAPDWMKGGSAGTTDWSRLNTAPTRAHYGDFAALAATAAARYPQVRYFQVWSELKGLYDEAANRWDYEAYTEIYNMIYDAVKKVRPDALVGGPYVVLDTWSAAGTSAPSALSGPWGVVDQRALDVIDYWNAHKHGADFLVVDGSSGTRDAGLTTDAFRATAMFGTVSRWLRVRVGLPVWWAEFYPTQPGGPQWSQESPAPAALSVAAVAQALRGGAARLLLWQPQASADVPSAALWTTPTANSDAALLPLSVAWTWLAANVDTRTTIDYSPAGTVLKIIADREVLTVNLTAGELIPPGQSAPLPAYGMLITPRR
ncbi:hypothetical protein [Amycolatopsis sp. DSM 110486]|uniref:hypothetical protein n=1 Tax=Amycolatopsis sp. DSM 110486 TaxID=2865832 RepID=UPI001C6A16F1|nr:hypothetical protein [Amycolatopsis sp. DSM 110486]QYN18958.1 hypothetical protein K1T34_40745 [Amycolatopsis sp. DSM 110486]